MSLETPSELLSSTYHTDLETVAHTLDIPLPLVLQSFAAVHVNRCQAADCPLTAWSEEQVELLLDALSDEITLHIDEIKAAIRAGTQHSISNKYPASTQFALVCDCLDARLEAQALVLTATELALHKHAVFASAGEAN